MSGRYQEVETLVRSAHRRRLWLLGVQQASLAASLVCAGVVVILLAGTQLLNWYWLLILALAGLGVAGYRLRHRLPTPYSTAQLVDSHFALHDSISTAWHVAHQQDAFADPAATQYQLAQAEALARQVNAKLAFPLRIQRSWSVAFALAGAAFALFAVRYLVRHDLDFKQALVPLSVERLAGAFQIRSNSAAAEAHKARSLSKESETALPQMAQNAAAQPQASEISGVKNPLGETGQQQGSHKNSSSSPNAKSNGPASGNGKENRESGGSNPDTSGAQKPGDNAEAKKESGSRSQNNSDSKNDSLMSRMKDAMSSLLAKAKPEEEPSQSAQQSSTKNSAAPDQDQTQAESGKSQSQSSASQSPNNNAKADAKSAEQGQATEMAQTAQNQNSGSSEHKGGNQSKSGAGKQDGGKNLKNTAEQEAMGKLAEIIGKRSAQVSGEMTVEVPSGKQQLKTAYTNKVTQHSDTGGEINRDEVPLALQDYVREYMERVHRQPPAKP